MIVSDQERAALMAHVRSYGNARDKAAHEREMGDYESLERWNKSAREYLAAIRAMLAPDDAVVRGRIAKHLNVDTIARMAWVGLHDQNESGTFGLQDESTKQKYWDAAEEIVRFVLAVLQRGEATRDE